MSMIRDAARFGAGISILSLALAAPAFAQEAPPAADAAATEGLQDIIVTAQKRSENLQTVPISVTAVTGDAIATQKITTVEGLANSIPNVQINSFTNTPSAAVFSIRGVGANDSDPYIGTTVSVVVDGVVVGVNSTALVSLFDIDRVEILRGPQGTLFGANTTGGVVNIVTKQPTGEFGGEGQLSYGNYDRIDVNASINLPITDSLAAKFSVLHTERDGYFTNLLDGRNLGRSNISSMRGYLRYRSGDYDATLVGQYDRIRNGSQTSTNFADASIPLSVPGVTDTGRIRFLRGQSPRVPDQDYENIYSLTLTQNLRSGIGDLVSITAYRKLNIDLYSDDDAVVQDYVDSHRVTRQYQLSQELRDTIQVNDNIQLLVGAFGFYQHFTLRSDKHIDGFAFGISNPQFTRQTNYSVSLFSQLYVDLTDRLRLQAGVRYAHERTKALATTALTFSPTGMLSEFSDPIIPGTFIAAGGRRSWDNVGYKIGLDYRINPEVMLYTYYARGFKSGGFTGRIVIPEDVGPFNPETLDTIEVGVKTLLFDRRLRFNLDGFYNFYRDIQVVQNISYPNGANSASIANAGGARTYGFEAEASVLPVEGLTISLSGAYLRAYYTRYDTQNLDPATGALVPVSYAGNDLVNAPKWNFAGSVNYEFPVGPGHAAIFGQYTYTSSKFTNFTDLPQERTRPIGLVNGNLSWSPTGDRWSIGIYGRNILNKHYYTQKLYIPGAFALAAIGAPREYGVDLRFHF